MPQTPQFEMLLYGTRDAVATITLNRPDQLNSIVPPMPDEIDVTVGLAERDSTIKVMCCAAPAARSPAPTTSASGGILDGLMRNTPDALDFIDTAANQGVRAAVERCDGPWGDYSQAPPDRRPDPSHIIVP